MPLDLTGVELARVEIRTERLLLRAPAERDVDAVFRACQDPDIPRWTVSLPNPYTRGDAEAWIRETAPKERAEGRGLAFVAETEGELVGSAGLTFRSTRSGNGVEVGYWLKDPRAPQPSQARAGTLHGGQGSGTAPAARNC